MVTNVKVGSFVKNTGGVTNEKNTITGLGFTPKGIKFETSQNTADTTFQTTCVMSMGYSDGTNHRSIYTSAKHALTTTETYRYQNNTKAIMIRASNGSLKAEGTVAFSAGQFEITWTTADTTANIINYIVFGGDDLTIEVGTTTEPTSNGSNHHAMQGDSDFLMMASMQNATENSLKGNSAFAEGMCTASNEGAATMWSDDAVTTTEAMRWLSSSHCLGIINTGDTFTGKASFSSFDGTGVNLTWTDTDGAARKIYYMAIKGGEWEVGLGTGKITTIGDVTVSTSFKPAAVMMISCGHPTNDAIQTQARFSSGFSDGTNHRGVWAGDKDAVTTTACQKYISDGHAIIWAEESTPALQSTLDDVTFNSTPEMILHYDVVDSSARLFIWAILKENSFTPRMMTF